LDKYKDCLEEAKQNGLNPEFKEVEQLKILGLKTEGTNEKAKELTKLINKTSNEGIDNVIDLVIEKARTFPEYPIQKLKEEAREWVKLFKHKEETKC
jgi:hypothetical protein